MIVGRNKSKTRVQLTRDTTDLLYFKTYQKASYTPKGTYHRLRYEASAWVLGRKQTSPPMGYASNLMIPSKAIHDIVIGNTNTFSWRSGATCPGSKLKLFSTIVGEVCGEGLARRLVHPRRSQDLWGLGKLGERKNLEMPMERRFGLFFVQGGRKGP